nr:hypothetical protein [Aeromicrobium sp. IC_218]
MGRRVDIKLLDLVRMCLVRNICVLVAKRVNCQHGKATCRNVTGIGPDGGESPARDKHEHQVVDDEVGTQAPLRLRASSEKCEHRQESASVLCEYVLRLLNCHERIDEAPVARVEHSQPFHDVGEPTPRVRICTARLDNVTA